jgi:hypothetical protein
LIAYTLLPQLINKKFDCIIYFVLLEKFPVDNVRWFVIFIQLAHTHKTLLFASKFQRSIEFPTSINQYVQVFVDIFPIPYPVQAFIEVRLISVIQKLVSLLSLESLNK